MTQATPEKFAEKFERAILREAHGGPFEIISLPQYEIFDERRKTYRVLDQEEAIERFQLENPRGIVLNSENEILCSVPLEPCPDWMTVYICVDEVSRHYGGPEEGGWWYDMGNPVEIEAIRVYFGQDKEPILKESEREFLVDLAKKWLSHYDFESQERYSMAPRGDDFSWRAESQYPKHWPGHRPHYE